MANTTSCGLVKYVRDMVSLAKSGSAPCFLPDENFHIVYGSQPNHRFGSDLVHRSHFIPLKAIHKGKRTDFSRIVPDVSDCLVIQLGDGEQKNGQEHDEE